MYVSIYIYIYIHLYTYTIVISSCVLFVVIIITPRCAARWAVDPFGPQHRAPCIVLYYYMISCISTVLSFNMSR